MRTPVLLFFMAVLMATRLAAGADEKSLMVRNVRFISYAAFTRIVFELEAAAPYVLTKSGDGRSITFAAYSGALEVASPLPAIHDSIVKGMELRREEKRTTIVLQLEAAAGSVKDFVLRGPDRIVIDVARGAAAPSRPAQPDKRIVIVIDPGHGGNRDTGLVSAQGQEKAVTLELADAVKRLLSRKNARFAAVLTRDKDQALSLDERAGFSNNAGAALFVSIHAGPGLETQVYIEEPGDGDVSSTPGARESFFEFDTDSERQEMLWGSQQAAHTNASGAFGRRLSLRLGAAGNEPVQAPLAALKAVDAAAVVVEVGMEQDRVRVAEALAEGIAQYVAENR